MIYTSRWYFDGDGFIVLVGVLEWYGGERAGLCNKILWENKHPYLNRY